MRLNNEERLLKYLNSEQSHWNQKDYKWNKLLLYLSEGRDVENQNIEKIDAITIQQCILLLNICNN